MKNVLGERRTIVLSDDAVVIAAYETSLLQNGKPVLSPARFTMVIVKRDGVWRITHHHSSLQSK